MPIDSDVLVIGGGLAGMTAALSGADTGSTVRLVSHKKSSLRLDTGLVDVLGYVPGRDEPVVDPFASLSALPPAHPYSVIGEAAVRAGLSRFDQIVGDEYLGNHTQNNALFPTAAGSVKPTARYPSAVRAGLLSDDRPMLLVGFRSLTDFDARLIADGLETIGVPFPIAGAEVAFPGSFRDDAEVTRLARALDVNEELRLGHDSDVAGHGPTDVLPAREALAETVKPFLGAAERVGFPAILGDENHHDVRASLEAELGCAVFELPMGPPSLPGRRLEAMLHNALIDAGVHVETGVPVVGYESNRVRGHGTGERLDTAIVDRNGQRVPYHADQFVLATGGLVGKGVRSDREGVYEPIFDCHIPHPDDRYDWFVDDAFGDHPFCRFGVVPDSDLRPLDATDVPMFENLRAAGSMLGGADVAAENSASGVSLATGHVAGSSAGEAV